MARSRCSCFKLPPRESREVMPYKSIVAAGEVFVTLD